MLASLLTTKSVLNSGRLARRHCDVVLKSAHPVSLHFAIWRTTLAAHYFIHHSCCIRSGNYSCRRACLGSLRPSSSDTRHHDVASLHRGRLQSWSWIGCAVCYSRRYYHNSSNPSHRDIELAEGQKVWSAYHVHVWYFVSFTCHHWVACRVF